MVEKKKRKKESKRKEAKEDGKEEVKEKKKEKEKRKRREDAPSSRQRRGSGTIADGGVAISVQSPAIGEGEVSFLRGITRSLGSRPESPSRRHDRPKKSRSRS